MTELEEEILSGCLSGDEKWQKRLYNQYSGKMYGVCLRYCANKDDARDVLQDGFIKVFQKLDTFKREGSFEGWIRRIIVNTALEELRKQAKFTDKVEVETVADELSDSTSLVNFDASILLNKIQSLAPGYRTIFNMYVIEGFQHNEIASMLGISENTSKSQLSRARKILQDMLLKSGIERH